MLLVGLAVLVHAAVEHLEDLGGWRPVEQNLFVERRLVRLQRTCRAVGVDSFIEDSVGGALEDRTVGS